MAKNEWGDDIVSSVNEFGDEIVTNANTPAASGGGFSLSDAAPDTGDESSRLAARYPAPKNIPSPTVGSVARDIASGVLQIGPTAVKGAASVARLVSGDTVGKDTYEAMERGQRSIQDMVGSERGQVQRDEFARDMADENVGLGQALWENKGALADQVLPTVGSMLLPIGVAGAAGKLAGATGRSVQAAQQAASIGSSVAMNAGETFSTIRDKGGELDQAYTGAAISAPFSYVAGRLSGGGAETIAARKLAGQAAGATGVRGVAQAVGKGAAGEAGQEAGEETGNYLGEAVGRGEELNANQAVKQIGVAATLGGLMGVGTGAMPSRPIDRTPQIEALRKAGDETAAALVEQRQQKEQAAYTTERETQAVAQINPELAQRYRDVRMAGAKSGDAVVQTAARWNFEQAAQLAGLSPKAQEAIAAKLADIPPEKAAAFVQKAITGMVQAGQAQPFEGMETIAQTIEAQRNQMLDSVLATMNDIETLEQQDAAQDPAQGATPTEVGPIDTAPAAAIPDSADAVLGVDEQDAISALNDTNDVLVTPELDAVHAAATSPLNDLPEPTDAQKKAGNYKVGKIRMSGLDISIENPQGSERRGVDADGKEWKTPMKDHYGYFKGTTAADGDKLDVFIKPGTPQDYIGPVFVVDQIDPSTGKFDEHKVVFGASDQAEAEAIYRRNYSEGWDGLANITGLPMPAFKAWASSKATRKPLGTITEKSNVQNPQAPAEGSQAQAAPDQARTDGASNAATASGVPAEAGAGDVQADGVAGEVDSIADLPGVEPGDRLEMFGPRGLKGNSWMLREKATGRAIEETRNPAKVRKLNTEKYEAVPIGRHLADLNDPTTPAYASARDLSKNPPKIDTSANPAQETAKSEQVEKPAPAHKPISDKTKGFRIASWKKNPLRVFLATHGVSLKLAKEFAPGKAERQAAMVSGYGPIFKRVGLEIDALAELAHQDGFLSSNDASEMYNLIARAFAGERIIPQYAEGVADAEMNAKLADMEEVSKAEYEDFLAVEPEDLDADIPFDADELSQSGYDELSAAEKKELGALLKAAEAEGIDIKEIQDEAQAYTFGKQDNEYKRRIEANIEAARNSRKATDSGAGIDTAGSEAERGSAGSSGEVAGQEGARPSVTLEDRPDGTLSVKGDTAAIKESLTTAGIPARSILPSATGVVVGKTQAKKAREVLEPKSGKSDSILDLPTEKLEKRLADLDQKREDLNAKHMQKYRDGGATRAQTTTHNARTSDLNEQIKEIKGELKRRASVQAEPTLTAPTKADIEAQQARTEQAAKDKAAADKAAAAREAKERERADVKRLSESAAGTFELDGDAMANLTGQKDVFGAADPDPSAKPDTRPAAMIEARKRLSVLQSLRKCIG